MSHPISFDGETSDPLIASDPGRPDEGCCEPKDTTDMCACTYNKEEP